VLSFSSLSPGQTQQIVRIGTGKSARNTSNRSYLRFAQFASNASWRISANLMNERTNSAPPTMPQIPRGKHGVPLEHEAGNICVNASTPSLTVAFGGEVAAALVIDEAYEGFGFFGRSRIDVAQQPDETERICPNQARRILNRL